MEFVWDANKAATNRAKHGVDFRMAVGVFFDEARIVIDQTKDGDARKLALGMVSDRLMAVVYTRRADAFRIISARFANSRERRRYGKE